MKSKTLTVFLAAFFVSQSARSAQFTWDGGTGTWDTTTTNWTGLAWSNTNLDEAIFGGTAGTVTINTGTGVTANKLTFNSDGYIINGHVSADTLTLAGTTPNITVTTAGQSATVNAIVAGTVGFTKAGAGTLVLNGANTYTGTTELSAGTLVIGHVDAMSGALTRTTGSGASILRLATDTSVSAFQLNSGTNRSYTVVSDRATAGAGITHALGSASLGGGSTNITFEAGGNVTSGTAGISLSSLSLSAGITGGTQTTALTPTTASLTILGNVTRTGATTGSTKVLALAGSSTGNSVGGSINNGDADDIIAVTKSGTSTWTLIGTTSNYTGVTTISGGVLEAAALANGGSNSSIGASANAAANLVFGASTATLRYIGSSNVTIDRGFTTSSGTGGGATIESSGAGTLTLDNTVAIALGTVDQTRAITLGGTNTGNNTLSKTLANNGTAATSLNKTGSGTWIVNGGNSFTGATNISGGTLVAGTVGALTTSSAVNISTTTGSGTLRLATDTSVDAYLIGLSSNHQGTIISDRATGGAGLTHALGAASVGANTINIQAGGNVASGTAGVSFASLSLASGGGGTTLLNPVASVLTISGAVSSTSNSAKTLELGGTSTENAISGVISNGTNVVSLGKSNTSTWTLDGAAANTYTGTTSVTSGTLILAKTAGINAIPGSLTIGDGSGNGIVQLANSDQIANGGSATFNGSGANAGIFRLNNNSEAIAGLVSSAIGDGIVENGNASAGTSLLTLNFDTAARTFSGILQDNGGSGSGVLALTKSGSGTQVLSGANTHSGATTVSGGVLRIANATALGATTAGTTVAGAATLEISGGISLGESLTLQGNNTASSANQLVSASGNNTITSNISTTSGGTNHSITSLADKLTINANVSPIVSGTRPLYLRGAGDGEITGGFNKGSADTAPLVKEGTGTWTLSGTSTFNGTTTISGGTMQIGNGGSTGRLTATSGITNNANLTINRSNDFTQASDLGAGAVISGTGSFTQAGSGTTTLTADNTYGGTTTVASGTLIVNGTHSGTGAATVASGAKLGGTGVLAASTTISGILAPGNSIGTLTIGNDVTWQGAASASGATDWQFDLGISNTSDLLNITGESSKFTGDTSLGSVFRFDFLGSTSAGTFTLVDWESTVNLAGGALGTNFLLSDFSYTNLGGSNTGTFGFNGTSLQFTVVPEPRAALIGGLGLLMLLRRRRS